MFILFLIYINDLYNVCCDFVPILFADDTNLFYKGADFGELVKSINAELENISLWLKVNKLSLNVKKTYLIIFQKGKSPISHIEIKIDNQTIDKVDKTNFFRCCYWFEIIMEKSYFPGSSEIIEKHWYDRQSKRILEQKCSSDPMLLICIPVLNIL